MRIILALSVAAIALGCARGARPDAPRPLGAAAPAQVFSGRNGERVEIVPIVAPQGQEQALIHIQGTRGELDGKVLRHDVFHSSFRGRRTETEYKTRWRGRDLRLLTLSYRGERADEARLYVLEQGDLVYLRPDPERTQALKVEDVLALHEKQREDGTLSRGMAYDRKFWTSASEQVLAGLLKTANEACGASMTATIAWDTITDAQANDNAIESFCGAPLESLQKLCARSDEAKRAIQSKVKSLECRVAETAAPRMEADKVVWTTSFQSPPQAQAITTFFTENL